MKIINCAINFFIKSQMTTLILFSAAAPARRVPLKSSEHYKPLIFNLIYSIKSYSQDLTR